MNSMTVFFNMPSRCLACLLFNRFYLSIFYFILIEQHLTLDLCDSNG